MKTKLPEVKSATPMPIAKAQKLSESELIGLLSKTDMSLEEFKRLYEGKFEPDPLLEETVEFLRTATYERIAKARLDGWLTPEMHRKAKRIIEYTNR